MTDDAEAVSGDGRKRTRKQMEAGWAARGLDHAEGEADGDRSRTDVIGAGDRRRKRSAMAQSPSRKRSNPSRSVPHRIQLEDGTSAPTGGLDPKPPPVMVIYQDLAAQVEIDFAITAYTRKTRGVPVYGQYPRALIAAMLPHLGCARHEILHVCSGSLPPGEGIRVDIRPEAKPDHVADGRKLPFASGTIAAVMIDPPYSKHYARELYGVDYPRPSHLLREARRVVRPAGRVLIVHYITPKPPKGLRFVKAWGLSTGFDMPMRALSLYERDDGQGALALAGAE